MSQTVTCPRCQRSLAVRSPDAGEWLTCPECLTFVRNTPPPPAPPSACRVCGESLQPNWRACPVCGEGTRPRLVATDFDRDLRRDRNGSWVGMGVLGVLLAVGAVWFFVSGGGELITASTYGPVIFGSAVVVVVALLVCVGVAGRSSDTGSRVAGGVMGGLGIAATVCLMFVLLICAGIMQFFADCGKGIK